jgi:hypothetical protein
MRPDPTCRFRDIFAPIVEFRSAPKISDPRKHWAAARKDVFSMFGDARDFAAPSALAGLVIRMQSISMRDSVIALAGDGDRFFIP